MLLPSKRMAVSALGIISCLGLGLTPAQADTIDRNAKEQINWFSASRQMQIIDDRPVVRDLRALPSQEQTVEIPGQPGVGVAGGTGAGCVRSGNSETIPRGGIHLGQMNLAYRTLRSTETNTVQPGSLLRPATNALPLKAPSLAKPLPRPPRGSLLRSSQSM